VAARIAGLLADEHRPHFEEALRRHECAAAPFEAAHAAVLRSAPAPRGRANRGARAAPRRRGALPPHGGDAVGRGGRAGAGATGERLRRRAPATPEELTNQERVIAGLVAAGSSNKDVAAELFLSPKTVEAHLTRIYRKLGVYSRTQLARRLDEDRRRSPAPG
jgi:DNA-binding CsgD family transcriptional regulator